MGEGYDEAAGADRGRARLDRLASSLAATRADTLATFAAFEAALPPGLPVPFAETLNPPRWELGHVGWFQAWWLERFTAWREGAAADPEAPRRPPRRAGADALYDSSRVAHASRWALPLPEAEAIRADLAAGLDATLSMLAALASEPPAPGAFEDDARAYFFELAVAHEDMHHEAALYMAQALAVPVADERWSGGATAALADPSGRAGGTELHFGPASVRLGHEGPGFVFDNELGAHEARLPAFSIDATLRRWADVLPCIEAGAMPLPPGLERGDGGRWWQRRFGRWSRLAEQDPALHLSAHDAEAWCRWAGRRLPSEAEWAHAAAAAPAAFHWGAAWEWTASDFLPFAGFVPHPYRDYSAPWFGPGRRVLRGASFATQPRMRRAGYRNFYPPTRRDLFTGLRSCALGAAR
jgi:EgtB-related family protein